MHKIEKIMADNGKLLRLAMHNWASGVAVVTSSYLGAQSGTTISSFTSVSLDPPLILFNLSNDNPTQTMIEQSGILGISILSQEQENIADIFAGYGRRIQDRFTGLQTFNLKSEAPLLRGTLANLDYRVYQILRLPKSMVIIAEVIAAQSETQGCPLVYHNRSYAVLA